MRQGREVPGQRRHRAWVFEGQQRHRQEVEGQRRSLPNGPGVARGSVLPEMRESRPRTCIERCVVAGQLGPALRQAREVGIRHQQLVGEGAA